MPLKRAETKADGLNTRPTPLYRVRGRKNGSSQNGIVTRPRALSAAQLIRIREEQLAMPFLWSVEIRRIEPKPFLKWAGGKSSLLSQFDQLFPRIVDRYFEPFLGGGAVFFHLKHRFPQMRAFLRDSNKELINCYRIVRDRPIELMRWLDHHQRSFRSEGAEYYYRVRKESDLTDDLARAARTIFLNKTCFNGLYRVNARGEFNTPVGSNSPPSLYNRDNLLAASASKGR
jgi:DNA adenine methylase